MAEALTRLYGVATDEETAVLDSLTLRAGLAWHCECGWHRHGTSPAVRGLRARSSSASPREMNDTQWGHQGDVIEAS